MICQLPSCNLFTHYVCFLWRDTTSETMPPGPIFPHWYNLLSSTFIIVSLLYRSYFYYFQTFDTFNTLVFSKTGRLTTFRKVGARGVCVLCAGSTLVGAPDSKQPSTSLRSPTSRLNSGSTIGGNPTSVWSRLSIKDFFWCRCRGIQACSKGSPTLPLSFFCFVLA